MIDAYFTLFVTTHGDTCLFMHVHVYVCVCVAVFFRIIMSTRSRTSPDAAAAAAATTMASPLTPTPPSTSRNHQCQAISVSVLVIECACVCVSVCVWEGSCGLLIAALQYIIALAVSRASPVSWFCNMPKARTTTTHLNTNGLAACRAHKVSAATTCCTSHMAALKP